MKFAPIAAALLLGTAVAAPAIAEENAAEAAAAAFTIDTPIEKLVDDERSKAVLMKHMGGQDISEHPSYEQFKSMSLKAVAPFSSGAITDEMLEKIAADLAEIK